MCHTKKMVICYDQESGYEGVQLIHAMFEAGWEELTPLRFTAGFYHKIFYRPDTDA